MRAGWRLVSTLVFTKNAIASAGVPTRHARVRAPHSEQESQPDLPLARAAETVGAGRVGWDTRRAIDVRESGQRIDRGLRLSEVAVAVAVEALVARPGQIVAFNG